MNAPPRTGRLLAAQARTSRFTLRACMAAQAEVRSTTEGAAYLYALVHQGDPSALPILAVQRYGTTAACHQAAHHKAAALKAGDAVVLYGGSLVLDRWLGQPVLLLCGEAEVQPANTRALHEAATTEAAA